MPTEIPNAENNSDTSDDPYFDTSNDTPQNPGNDTSDDTIYEPNSVTSTAIHRATGDATKITPTQIPIKIPSWDPISAQISDQYSSSEAYKGQHQEFSQARESYSNK